jgi:hypothetical protein
MLLINKVQVRGWDEKSESQKLVQQTCHTWKSFPYLNKNDSPKIQFHYLQVHWSFIATKWSK